MNTEEVSRRVPMIRIKLKVPNGEGEEGGKGKEKEKEKERVVITAGGNGNGNNAVVNDTVDNNTVVNDTCDNNTVDNNTCDNNTVDNDTVINDTVVNDTVININTNQNSPQTETQTSLLSPTFSTSPSHKFHGTFKYRPFKLYPLLPIGSRYRVLVPRKYTRNLPAHPAVRRNYLWGSGVDGVYTDDSDLVCIVIKEGLYNTADENKEEGVDLLIEVEVTDINENVSKEDKEDFSAPLTNTITPRFYHNHDGNHIKVIRCLPNPPTVHLKRWRKFKKRPNDNDNNNNNTLTTPKFKISSQ